MNRFTRRALPVIAGGALALGVLAGPAFAGATPGNCSTTAPVPTTGTPPNSGTATNAGGNCQVEGSATISATLAFEVGLPGNSFSFPNGTATPNINTGAGLSPNSPYFLYVFANTPGYYISEAITTPFTGVSNSAYVLKASDFEAGVNGTPSGCDSPGAADNLAPFVDSAANDGTSNPLQVVSVPCPSSGYNYQNNNHTIQGDSTGFPTPTDQFSDQGWAFTSSQTTTGISAPAQVYQSDVTLALWG